jgi:uridine phosphorylase
MGTLYMNGTEEDIASIVIFSGDPWRIEVIKKYLDDVKHIAFKREFNTYTGTYKGVPITVTSTGIGAPSAAVAMEEMYECGMKVAVRMGTVMSLIDDTLGDFIIPVGSVRRESTSKTYVEEAFPAVADFDLVNAMNKSVESFKKKHINGITATLDGFYSEMHDSKFSKEKKKDMNVVYEELKDIGVIGLDMESSLILTLGRLMGVKTAIVTVVTVLENLKAVLTGQDRPDAEELLCRVVLEGLYNYSKNIGV